MLQRCARAVSDGFTVLPDPLLPTMMVRGRKNSMDSGAESEYDRTPWMDSLVIVVIG